MKRSDFLKNLFGAAAAAVIPFKVPAAPEPKLPYPSDRSARSFLERVRIGDLVGGFGQWNGLYVITSVSGYLLPCKNERVVRRHARSLDDDKATIVIDRDNADCFHIIGQMHAETIRQAYAVDALGL